MQNNPRTPKAHIAKTFRRRHPCETLLSGESYDLRGQEYCQHQKHYNRAGTGTAHALVILASSVLLIGSWFGGFVISLARFSSVWPAKGPTRFDDRDVKTHHRYDLIQGKDLQKQRRVLRWSWDAWFLVICKKPAGYLNIDVEIYVIHGRMIDSTGIVNSTATKRCFQVCTDRCFRSSRYCWW